MSREMNMDGDHDKTAQEMRDGEHRSRGEERLKRRISGQRRDGRWRGEGEERGNERQTRRRESSQCDGREQQQQLALINIAFACSPALIGISK